MAGFPLKLKEKLVCEPESMRDVLHGAAPQRLEHELCPFSDTFSLSHPDKNKIKSAHLYAALTAFQVGAYTGRGWF